MNWGDGVKLWFLSKLGLHVFLVSSASGPGGSDNHRSVDYAPGALDSRVGSSRPRSRRHTKKPVWSTAPSGRLRCQRCGNRRSRSYHHRHCHDPIAYPAIGVCSRRWTGCADAKMPEWNTGDRDARERSIAELPGWEHGLDPTGASSRERSMSIMPACA